MGYHLSEIPKGVYGEVSKITEEYLEFLDAHQQSKVMELVELSDLLGAIEAYITKEYKGTVSLNDLIKMKDLTKSAFEDGSRK